MLIALGLAGAFVLIQAANFLRYHARSQPRPTEFRESVWTIAVFFDCAALALIFYAGMLAAA
jgi:hypothetical protein